MGSLYDLKCAIVYAVNEMGSSLKFPLDYLSFLQRSTIRNILMFGFHFLVYFLCVKGVKDTQVNANFPFFICCPFYQFHFSINWYCCKTAFSNLRRSRIWEISQDYLRKFNKFHYYLQEKHISLLNIVKSYNPSRLEPMKSSFTSQNSFPNG